MYYVGKLISDAWQKRINNDAWMDEYFFFFAAQWRNVAFLQP